MAKDLARTARAHGLDGDLVRGEVFAGKRQPKARRHAVFEDFERQRTGAGLQVVGLVLLVVMTEFMAGMGAAVIMMMAAAAAAEQKNARDIDRQSEHGDRDRLVEV